MSSLKGPQAAAASTATSATQGIRRTIQNNVAILHTEDNKMNDSLFTATKPLRELYVGNLPPTLKCESLLEFLNAAMVAVNGSVRKGPPVVRTSVVENSRYGFAEVRSIQEAKSLLGMNGIELLGHRLRISRPRTYSPQMEDLAKDAGESSSRAAIEELRLLAERNQQEYTKKLEQQQQKEQGEAQRQQQSAVSQTTSLSFAASLRAERERLPSIQDAAAAARRAAALLDGLQHPSAPTQSSSSASSSSTYNPLGVIQEDNRPTDLLCVTGFPARLDAKKASCLVKYSDRRGQRAAEQGVPGMTLGSSSLRVLRTDDPETVHSELGEALLAAQRQTVPRGLLDRETPSSVLVLRNIVTFQELLSDSDYTDILDDITVECAKFGKVLDTLMPRPPTAPDTVAGSKGFPPSVLGLVFVAFEDITGATNARRGLQGRRFGNNRVETIYFPKDKFERRELEAP
uniref:RRM domain-containing protein n=1 Tax=Chromera velia CCMP2878 TaxID=1169474 RepID=A0A0G4HT26_9ALVE|eukprot:Cvel_8388.t1-p1 / transcript=Cvel_8388.t1 / gene=Cvel_8388 / organism=Chromera_velia_CCMP2878 / gene_product=Splicing factor U2af large subunit A, putative / transcript_product=Splicing factor U2af large subunit A, putative / location=Cvel_scaffold462:74522-78582(-) / protein_length=458 / sequence_SO=supercontig / SO=protein_coding / is_pseudo=false